MQVHRVIVIIILTYTQTVLPSLKITNSLRREMSNLIKKTNNNNNQGGILTQKGRKIQLSPDGNFIICGIDSLEDDYYGCQSSSEVYLYKTYRTGISEERKQVSMAATKGSIVKKIENIVPTSSSTAALTPISKPTIMIAYYASTRQADLFSPRASNKLFDYLDIVHSSRSLIKNTSSSTTPIFATSSETQHPLSASSKTAPANNVGNLIKLHSRFISIPRTTTQTPKSKPNLMMAYDASTHQTVFKQVFSPRASDKLFDYLDTVRPSRSLFKMTKSSTTPIFATSAETPHFRRPNSNTAPASNVDNLIKQQSRILSIPRTTMSTKTKPTIMFAYYASERQADLFSTRAADKLFDYHDTERPSRPLFSKTQSSTTPIFATSTETRNPVRTNSKRAPTNNVGNLVKLKNNIIPILKTQKAESNTPIETLAKRLSHMPSTRSIVWRDDTELAIKHLFNY